MKKTVSFFLSALLIVTCFNFGAVATDKNEVAPTVLSFSLTTEADEVAKGGYTARVTGLITSYGLSLEKSGTTLKIYGQTYATGEVVKCGFKNLVIQRRASSSDSWKDYYDYGDVYADGFAANLSTTLSVASGYQYRISCKHYAKKNLLLTQSISNTSNIVIV